MGQEVSTTHFKHYDFHRFDKLVAREMELLREWFREERFSAKRSIAGLELEAWLVDDAGQPTPWNEQVIALAGSDDIVPELSRFNVEFNVTPQPLAGRGMATLADDLAAIWQRSDQAARQLGTSVVAIGILPTLTDPMLSLANLSKLHRFQALNEQVLRLRQGSPIRLEISGRDTLVAQHRDVMLEAATTSFQLHLQTPMHEAVRYYNAATVLSAPMVAVAGNSPLLFGKRLWDETRIPLFEQAVDVGRGRLPRVTLGSNYAEHSLEEFFLDNQAHYPILLPLVMDDLSSRIAHVRLHNGTIWRWNRPLIGFDDDGTPHLRIEHRVMAAGPTLIDMSANMVFFYGLIESVANESPAPETRLPFGAARDNFYRAARHGLDCDVYWLNGARVPLRTLLLERLLPQAALGLEQLAVDPALASSMLAVIEARVRSGQTGAVWQRWFFERHDSNCAVLTQAYRERQQSNEPVHTWSIEHRVTPVFAGVGRSMLRIVNGLPAGLLDAHASDLADLLGGPTLIHLSGRRPEPLFVSILLHGNEDVGVRAVQCWFREHGARPLPRSLSIFVGNVRAARKNMRHLPNQPDYNRVWPGSDSGGTPEHILMQHVVAEMRERRVFASLDLHNNSGLNPYYACVARLDRPSLHLAALFGRTAVFFERPHGVQARAFAELCPAVTCECGKVGDEGGLLHAARFLDACLRLAEIPDRFPAAGDLHLFRTVATVNVRPYIELAFANLHADVHTTSSELTLRSDFEQLNFQELRPGTLLGRTRSPADEPIVVIDQSGRTVTSEFLAMDDGQIRLLRSVIPAMLSCDHAAIRQDCLGYFMERYPFCGEVT